MCHVNKKSEKTGKKIRKIESADGKVSVRSDDQKCAPSIKTKKRKRPWRVSSVRLFGEIVQCCEAKYKKKNNKKIDKN